MRKELLGLIAGAGMAAGFGCARKNLEQPSPGVVSPTPIVEQMKTPLPSTQTPFVVETPASIQTPEPTTPEVKAAPCVTIPDEYCASGDIIEWEFQGIPRKLVGLRLPPNVPIFAPRDDTIRKTTVNQPSPFAGFMATLLALGRPVPSYAFYGDLRFESMIEQKAKKGDIIARTQDTGTKMFGDYSVVLWVSQTDPETKKAFTPEDLLKEMFPNIYSKPHKKASYEGEIKPSYINVFSDNPVPK